MDFPKEYRLLNIDQFNIGQLNLVPIRFKDKEKIRLWRNKQIDILRQKNKLTREEQKKYFESVVPKIFNEEEPKQILFSLLENKKLVAYGGLVHINWIDKHAEISFLTEPNLNQTCFEKYWTIYLKLIQFIAFDILKLKKIFTYTYEIRYNLFQILNKNNFQKEARLKNHCYIDGEFKDVLIHSIFAPISLNFREAKTEDVKLYFKWFQDHEVRKQSFKTDKVSFKDHENWFKSKINDTKVQMFLFNSLKQDLAQVRIEQKDGEYIISFSIDKKFRGKGLASRILRLASREFLKHHKQKLVAYIRKSNSKSIQSFENAGFKLTSSLLINNKIPSYKYSYEN